MHFGLSDETKQRVDDLTHALERQADANLRLAAAIEAHTTLLDYAQNRPRG